MQKLLKHPLSILQNSINNFFIFNDQQFSINNQQDNFLNQPTSPSYILTSNRSDLLLLNLKYLKIVKIYFL